MKARERLTLATPHHLATDAGGASLRRGGTALDAALAAGATLMVVARQDCAIGGDPIAPLRLPRGATAAGAVTAPRWIVEEDEHLYVGAGAVATCHGAGALAVRGHAACHAQIALGSLDAGSDPRAHGAATVVSRWRPSR